MSNYDYIVEDITAIYANPFLSPSERSNMIRNRVQSILGAFDRMTQDIKELSEENENLRRSLKKKENLTPIIRCKECLGWDEKKQYMQGGMDSPPSCLCNVMTNLMSDMLRNSSCSSAELNIVTPPEFYCYYAKRKEDADVDHM